MSHALITGGAGFIGLHLARRLLDEGWRVDLLDNFGRGARDTALVEITARDGATLIDADLADTDTVAGLLDNYSHVFHLAAILGVRNVIERPFRVLDDNLRLTLAALALARRQTGLERFVFASTSEVYAGTLAHFDLPLPTPEDTPLALTDLAEPRTAYMLSKLYGEALCRHAGLPFTILRPHNVYGPRMGLAHVVPQLLEKAHAAPDGGAIEVFSPDHRRTFCFIDDAVEMLFRCACTTACEGQVLNLGRGAPELTIRELAEIVIDTVGRRLAIAPGPETPGSPARRCPDMSRMEALTGYRARVSLENGVRRTWDWYRPNMFEAPVAAARGTG